MPLTTAFFSSLFRLTSWTSGAPPGRTPNAVPLEEVQAGKRYAVILTTCAGLWRYHIGDTLRFVSLAPLTIEFTGRDRFLDRFEEKVTQGEVEEAIAALNRTGRGDVREFIVGPDIAGRRHVWVLAMGEEGETDERFLAEELDRRLREMNTDYATFRRSWPDRRTARGHCRGRDDLSLVEGGPGKARRPEQDPPYRPDHGRGDGAEPPPVYRHRGCRAKSPGKASLLSL